MRSSSRRALGAALVAVGLAGAFFTLGPAALGDCGPACVARGERAVAVGLGVGFLALAVVGVVLVARRR